MILTDNKAYDKAYVSDVAEKHACLFCLLYANKEFDIFSMIDVYMRQSEVRKKMDKGNWQALNKSCKQMYNSIDFSQCQRADSETFCDKIMLEWIAKVYVYLQWVCRMSSEEINRKLPAKELAKAYNPLHETSYVNACKKLYLKYLANKE